jgi:hypothetical protein
MNLLDLFESTNEGYTVTRGIDKDRYQERRGLEGPFQTKSGKVVYYDKKEGKYYDPDTDMYIDHEDYRALDESELAEMFEASYGAPLFDDDGEISSNKRTERILGLLRAKNPTAQNDLEALIMSFDKGQKMDREDINTLYSQNREEEREIDQLEKDLEALKKRRGMNEDYYETDEQRELARLGRILKDMGKKRDGGVGEAMGFLGTQLTRYGTPQGVNSIEKLEQVTGLPESTIMKWMALAQKVQGDVAVGDETAGNDDEDEEVKTEGYQDSLKNKIGRASDEFDVTPDNWEVKIDGKPWKVFRTKASANKAASTIEMRYGKKTTVFATRKPVSEGIAEDFDDVFRKHLDLYTKSQKVRDYRADKAQQNLDRMKAMDPGNINPLIIDKPKAHMKARKAGVPQSVIKINQNPTLPDEVSLDENASLVKDYQDMKAQGKKDHNIIDVLMSMPKYNRMSRDQMAKIIGDAKRKGIFKEELDHDIKIGDTVETLKMGQMQGVVTGFSTKYGDTRVMFKHKSGKVYATPASNLKVISSKKSESQVVENIDLRHNLQPGTYKHNEENITVTINSDSSVSFKQPAEWEIEGDGEYLEFVETQLADAGNWTAVVEEAKKKPVPTKPDKWAYAKAEAKKKFDVYPSAYANAWAAKKYKELGGGWRMGKPKK